MLAAMLSDEIDSCQDLLDFHVLLIVSELLCLRELTTIDFLVGIVELSAPVQEMFA